DIYLLFRCDNKGTVGAVEKSRSPNYWINSSVQRIIQRILSRAGNQDHRTLNLNSPFSSQTSSMNSSFMFRFLLFSLPVTDTDQRPHQGELPNTSEQHFAPRKAQKDRVIANNNLRPNVRAAERLNVWTSSFAQNQSASNSLRYPKHILTAAQSLIADSWADQTKSTYGAGLLRWHQFCDGENIPDEMRMPAPEILIAGFVASHAGSVTGSTIRSWLSGIRAWHIINQAPWPENSELLALARRSANVKGSHLRRTQWNPITLQHLLALRASLNLDLPFHCAVWALALACFWGCRRLGELTVPSESKFNPCYHVTRTGTITNFLIISERRRLKFHIPWSKTTREQGADVVASSNITALCPCEAFELHWSRNEAVPNGSPLFAFIDEQGTCRHMTK
ncbi:hypothetical protein FB446DRAFT_835273, partial [Lentinula raphanica]